MSNQYTVLDGVLFEVARTHQEITTGMSKYKNPPIDNRVESIYPYMGMLFILKGQYNVLTMRQMRYPLWVSFYDRNWNLLRRVRASPSVPIMKMPQNTYYMIELP